MTEEMRIVLKSATDDELMEEIRNRGYEVVDPHDDTGSEPCIGDGF
jgi:hypothetical protein